MAKKAKDERKRKVDQKRAGKSVKQSQADSSAESEIRDAELAISKSQRDLENARMELARNESELTRLLTKYGRVPAVVSSEPEPIVTPSEQTSPLLVDRSEPEHSSMTIASPPVDVSVSSDSNHAEETTLETIALFDQKQVVR